MHRTIAFILGCILCFLPNNSFPANKALQNTEGPQSPIVNVSPNGNSIINYGIPRTVSHMIRGTLATYKYMQDELDALSNQLGISKFDLSLDDPILKDYYIIKYRIENRKAAIKEPITFHIFSGTPMSKILDIKQKVKRPKYKSFKMTHSIPKALWVWPTQVTMTWENKDDGQVTYDIYKSLLPEVGYGQVNLMPLTSPFFKIAVEPLNTFKPVYYRVSAKNEWAEFNLSEPIELQHLLTLSSFNKKENLLEKTTTDSNEVIERVLDESQLEFAKGRVHVTFENGLDTGTDMELFILCKMLPGSSLKPGVEIEGSPSIYFDLKSKISALKSVAIRGIVTDELKTSLTPPIAKYYANFDSICLKWEKPKNSKFSGIRIFRLTEQELENQHEVNNNQEIYDGPGLNKKFGFDRPENKDLCIPQLPTSTRPSLQFLNPPERNKTIATEANHQITDQPRKLSPPRNLKITSRKVPLDSDYYIDHDPKKHAVLTYIVYGYDKDGHYSWPIVIKATLPEKCNKNEERPVP